MKHPPFSAAGFTLIEMMISVGLGTLIVLTAVAGLRTASQSISAANRLSVENSLLRAGYFEAQIQLDFWTNLDNPNLPDAERPLKSPSLSVGQITDWTGQGRNRGMPFTPMETLKSRNIWPSGSGNPRFSPTALTYPSGCMGNWVMPRPQSAIGNANWELDRGWDPTYAWAPHDPRTWSRANLAEKDRPNGGRGDDGNNNFPYCINGRYAIFGNTNPNAITLESYTIKKDLNNPDLAMRLEEQQVTYSGYTGGTIYSWYYNQLDGLIDAMGYAAFCEYLPANAIYTWYSDHGSRSKGGINLFGISPNYNFTNWDGDQRNSRGIYRNTYSTSYGYIHPESWDYWDKNPAPTSGTAMTGNLLRQRFYQHYNSDYNATDGGGANELQWLLSHVNFKKPLLEIKPESWPDVEVSVGRLIKNAHHVAVARVSRVSNLTGEEIELSWTGLGTTLRGARQQRHQTTGWAQWDNKVGATIDPTLDTP